MGSNDFDISWDIAWQNAIAQANSLVEWRELVDRYRAERKRVFGSGPSDSQIPRYSKKVDAIL